MAAPQMLPVYPQSFRDYFGYSPPLLPYQTDSATPMTCELPPTPPATPITHESHDQNLTLSAKLLSSHKLHPEFLKRYSLGQELGFGGFGFVISATQHQDNREVAVKFIFRDKVPGSGWAYDHEMGVIPMEIYVLKTVRHKTIIEFIDTFQDDKYFYLIMELHGTQWTQANPQQIFTAPISPMPSPPTDSPGFWTLEVQQESQKPPLTLTSRTDPIIELEEVPSISSTQNGEYLYQQQDASLSPSSQALAKPSSLIRRTSCDLFECLERHLKFTEDQAKVVFRQIVDCVHYLDKRGICHRDIKDENIVIDSNFVVKLIDFGSAVLIPRHRDRYFDRFNGTVCFASPEILTGALYRAEPAEIWSLGILLYTILYGEGPFDDYTQVITTPFRNPCVISSPECTHLLTRMLNKHPDQRATIEEVSQHPWLH
ncbi:kinase-like domain-containing protein [Endogone sp. FLAS-F59071]|nr:kinase-like domain-containing protein [Endogone sp. FLAS-F59071]|eukprot:RUS22513.1 kinase-like domain-containing protein [Endogone sp. FLAS-F59071]